MRNARAPPRSMFSCCFTAFDAFSREDLGHFSGHFSRWSHFLVQISELFSRPAVTFSRSNFGTFSSRVASTFSRAILGVQTPALDPPPPPKKKHDFGKVLGYGGPQKMFPWKRFSWIFVWQLSRLATKRLWPASFEGMTTTPMSWSQQGKAPGRPDRSESSV